MLDVLSACISVIIHLLVSSLPYYQISHALIILITLIFLPPIIISLGPVLALSISRHHWCVYHDYIF